MKLRRSPSIPPAILFAVPVIQLPLLLLFFLLPKSSMLLQPGISVSVPDSPFVLSPRQDPAVVTVPPPPSSSLFFSGLPTDIDGLRTSLEGLGSRSRTIVVRADRRAPYDRVVQVMNLALEMGFPVVLATTEERAAP